MRNKTDYPHCCVSLYGQWSFGVKGWESLCWSLYSSLNMKGTSFPTLSILQIPIYTSGSRPNMISSPWPALLIEINDHYILSVLQNILYILLFQLCLQCIVTIMNLFLPLTYTFIEGRSGFHFSLVSTTECIYHKCSLKNSLKS